ncbi:MAG: hypothetical protein ACP5NF_03850 [Thermoanaerobaculum sp.]
MRAHHLTEDEWETLLAGEASEAVREHVAGCPLCREELKKWEAFLAVGRRWLPDRQVGDRVRQQAVSRALRRRPLRLWLPLAAAAALVVAIGLATRGGGRPEADVDAVLEQVDTALARDPLLAVADNQVVQVVIPEVTSGERSES